MVAGPMEDLKEMCQKLEQQELDVSNKIVSNFRSFMSLSFIGLGSSNLQKKSGKFIKRPIG